MNVTHNKKKEKELKKKGFPNKKVEKNVYMEIQQLESADNFGDYRKIPRATYALVHSLNGEYKNCFGVGLDPRYRMIINPEIAGEKVMESRACSITEYCIDYHKE